MYKLGDRIKEARQDKGLTQAQLAKVLHTAQNTISNWEKGTNAPDVEMLRQIIIVLDCDPSYILGIGD